MLNSLLNSNGRVHEIQVQINILMEAFNSLIIIKITSYDYTYEWFVRFIDSFQATKRKIFQVLKL